MAADDAQPAVETRNSGAPARPPQPLVFGPNKAELWNIFRRRWSNYCTLSNIATKPRNYQVAMLENSLGAEAMRLYDGFHFATPQEHRTTMEILTAFDEVAMGRQTKHLNGISSIAGSSRMEKVSKFPCRSTRVGKNLQLMSSMCKLDDTR